MKNYVAHAEIIMNATPGQVWEALTNPQLVKQYMFGSEVESDWKPGSAILYRGEWDGKKYEDKGTILEIEPEKKLVATYYSPMGGQEDKPENYATIQYNITTVANGTKLEVSQDNDKNEADAAKHQEGWQAILQAMKSIVEQ